MSADRKPNALDAAVAAFVGALMEDYSAEDINAAFGGIGYVRAALSPGAEVGAAERLSENDLKRLDFEAFKSLGITLKEMEMDGMHWAQKLAFARAIERELLAARSGEAVAPEGWVTVPNTATHNMLNAANAGRKKGRSSSGDIYRAMIEVAPRLSAQSAASTTMEAKR